MTTLLIRFYKSEENRKNIKVTYMIAEYNLDDGIAVTSAVYEKSRRKIVDLSKVKEEDLTVEEMLYEMLSIADEEYREAGNGFEDDACYCLRNVMKSIRKRDDMLLCLISRKNIVYESDDSEVDTLIYNVGNVNRNQMER